MAKYKRNRNKINSGFDLEHFHKRHCDFTKEELRAYNRLKQREHRTGGIKLKYGN